VKGLIITDLEGTLSCSGHRQHLLHNDMNEHDWDNWNRAFEYDRINYCMVSILSNFAPNYHIGILSTKPDKYVEMVDQWLKKIPIEFTFMLMRPEGDLRHSPEVKYDMVHSLDVKRIYCAFDDRQDVCDMYKDLGIKTFKVN